MKPQVALAFLFLLAALLLLFPPGSAGSAVFYISLLFLLLAFFLSSWNRGVREGLAYLRLTAKIPLRLALAWGAVAFLAAGAAALVVSLIFSGLGSLDSGLVEEKVLSLPWQALLAAFTLAPFAEEALFRGYLFRKISELSTTKSGEVNFMSYAAGALVSSALFAAMHLSYGSLAEVAVAFTVSLAFCAATQKSGSLLPAVFAHISFNLLSIILMVFA